MGKSCIEVKGDKKMNLSKRNKKSPKESKISLTSFEQINIVHVIGIEE